MGRRSSPASVLLNARDYCARQERCQQELRDKLYNWGVREAQVEPIIAQLIGEGFLNEARFAQHFAVGKFRQKGWGQRKIEQALRLKQVSEPCIALGLKAIDGQEAAANLEKLVAKRWAKEKELDRFRKRQKVMVFFLRRGFAVEEVDRALTHAEA